MFRLPYFVLSFFPPQLFYPDHFLPIFYMSRKNTNILRSHASSTFYFFSIESGHIVVLGHFPRRPLSPLESCSLDHSDLRDLVEHRGDNVLGVSEMKRKPVPQKINLLTDFINVVKNPERIKSIRQSMITSD